MSARAWPAFDLCSLSSQPTKVLALLVNDGADLGVKPGAASVVRRRQVKAIANTGNELESIFIKRYALRDVAAVCLTGPSRIVKGVERGLQTAIQVGEFLVLMVVSTLPAST